MCAQCGGNVTKTSRKRRRANESPLPPTTQCRFVLDEDEHEEDEEEDEDGDLPPPPETVHLESTKTDFEYYEADGCYSQDGYL
ncbi:hypothetical protein ARMSODRAFT_963171, partial [Armillaria solidipes]